MDPSKADRRQQRLNKLKYKNKKYAKRGFGRGRSYHSQRSGPHSNPTSNEQKIENEDNRQKESDKTQHDQNDSLEESSNSSEHEEIIEEMNGSEEDKNDEPDAAVEEDFANFLKKVNFSFQITTSTKTSNQQTEQSTTTKEKEDKVDKELDLLFEETRNRSKKKTISSTNAKMSQGIQFFVLFF
jgi:hypothetical protein